MFCRKSLVFYGFVNKIVLWNKNFFWICYYKHWNLSLHCNFSRKTNPRIQKTSSWNFSFLALFPSLSIPIKINIFWPPRRFSAPMTVGTVRARYSPDLTSSIIQMWTLSCPTRRCEFPRCVVPPEGRLWWPPPAHTLAGGSFGSTVQRRKERVKRKKACYESEPPAMVCACVWVGEVIELII